MPVRLQVLKTRPEMERFPMVEGCWRRLLAPSSMVCNLTQASQNSRNKCTSPLFPSSICFFFSSAKIFFRSWLEKSLDFES